MQTWDPLNKICDYNILIYSIFGCKSTFLAPFFWKFYQGFRETFACITSDSVSTCYLSVSMCSLFHMNVYHFNFFCVLFLVLLFMASFFLLLVSLEITMVNNQQRNILSYFMMRMQKQCSRVSKNFSGQDCYRETNS